MPTPPKRRLGMLGGVFVPTLLTILGVLMYLRLGWVVGNGGLLGGLAVILLAVGIAAATGLSLSSVATNTRLGQGGPYSIIRSSLGLEIGGAVGVPLYLSQAIAVAMYLFGFREGWLWVFPDHPAALVDALAFLAIFVLAMISAELAFRIQYVIMAIIGVSVVLILGSPDGWSGGHSPQLWGTWMGSPEDDFSGTSFWQVFAVFFPAATGVMAGANMSGELANPRKDIPRGTLAAIAVSAVIYVLLAVWASRAGTPEELAGSYTFLIDHSLWAPGVLLGLLGATFSSALTSLVGAPRVLVALLDDGVFPDVLNLRQRSADGEPRRAMIFTGLLVVAVLAVRDLNAVAPLVTMFFLIAYGVINSVVLIEGRLGLQSFRPTMSFPPWVAMAGAVGCVFSMFTVNPFMSLVSVGVVVALYAVILRRRVQGKGDVRSGLFSSLAEWAAARSFQLEHSTPRTWKPHVLVAVDDLTAIRGDFQLLLDLVRPEGTLKLLGIATQADSEKVQRRLNQVIADFRAKKLFTTGAVIDSTDLQTGVITGTQVLQSAIFAPNLLFYDVSPQDDPETTRRLAEQARRLRIGLALLVPHPRAGLGQRRSLKLWLELPEDLGLDPLQLEGLHLQLLVGLRLSKAWGDALHVFAVTRPEHQAEDARRWLDELTDLARLPASTTMDLVPGPLAHALSHAETSDLDLLPMPEDHAIIREAVRLTRSACLFLGDSGKESVLA